jgi:hypothetical protein
MTEKVQGGKPGSEKRWAFLEGFDIGADGDPYLDRLRIIQTPLFGVYLHHIHREDRDQDPHDHPWVFISLVLAGAYMEKVFPDKKNLAEHELRYHPRWCLAKLGREAAHMITDISPDPLWTLVVTGPRRSDWGFWREGKFIPWREYTK